MGQDHGLGNLRFEGYSYPALAAQLDGLRQGPGGSSLEEAVRALKQIAVSLEETDRTLRTELARIGVEWEGAASQGGQEATQQAGVYAEEAGPVVAASASQVGEQGSVFASTSRSAPQGGELRGDTQQSVWDKAAGAFGWTTDHAHEVQQRQQAHDAAAAAMNEYKNGSQAAISGAQSLPVPPGLDLVAQPQGAQGGTSAQSFTVNSATFTPGGGGGAPGAPGSVGVPGGGSGQFGAFPGGGGGGGSAGSNGNSGNANSPGSPGSNSPNGPGRLAGIGPTGSNPGGLPVQGASNFGGLRPGLGMMDGAATAAGIAGAGGAGAAAGAALERDRVVRGAAGGGAAGGAAGGAKGVTPDGAEGKNRSPIAGAPEEQARAARNAEKLGAGRGGRGPSSVMSPAAGAGAPGEDDDEHVRKYGIDSDDVFGDERLVVNPVLGQDE
ncbi:PPE domain-containing protein [Actinokineospora pegani]|uniref:PPE domain-containing protein n=1 Tax=Actinokineospora pegani TaxID=2654637 RepID=UPI0012EA72D2|nr:PPE domain-containing protein [Actinokineospora pegani]